MTTRRKPLVVIIAYRGAKDTPAIEWEIPPEASAEER